MRQKDRIFLHLQVLQCSIALMVMAENIFLLQFYLVNYYFLQKPFATKDFDHIPHAKTVNNLRLLFPPFLRKVFNAV